MIVTVVLLAVYRLASRIPLPGTDSEALRSMGVHEEFSGVLALGIAPFISGFLLVELFSWLVPAGRRLRQAGSAGRAKLNRAALIVSFGIGATVATTRAKWLVDLSTPAGWPIVKAPGFPFLLLTVLTLTAGMAAVLALCQFLSVYGIGNGFALVVLTVNAQSLLKTAASLRDSTDFFFQGTVLLAIVALVLLLVRLFRSAERAGLPAFPQGVLPVHAAAYTFFAAPAIFGFAYPRILFEHPPLAEPLWAVITIPLFSWLGFHLFSSRARLQANLTDPHEFLDDLAATLRRRAVITTALLTLGTAAFLASRAYEPKALAYSLGFAQVIAMVATVFDLWDQYRFQRQGGATVLLAQLDNVHFSYRLEKNLHETGIDTLARGHRLRSLYFFFGALIKIDVLVPAEQLDRAREVLAEMERTREVRAF